MTTLIRIFNKNPIENIMSALAYPYDTIVTVWLQPYRHTDQYVVAQHINILKEYQLKPHFIHWHQPLDQLNELMDRYPDADIDLTSATLHQSMRLFTTITGTHNIFYYDHQANAFFSITGTIDHLTVQNLHIRHSIESCGAAVKPDSLHYSPKDFQSENDRAIIKKIYKIFSDSIENGAYGLIEAFPYALSKSKNNILYLFDTPQRVERKGALRILSRLEDLDILSIYDANQGKIKMNPKYAHIFKVMGQILEMYLYIICYESNIFDDVKMSMRIDFNGLYINDRFEATSEIDLITIKNNHPNYLSCKLSKVHQEDIYEIYTNAHHFGGAQASALLAVSSKARKINAYMNAKAKELEVMILNKEDLVELDHIFTHVINAK